VGPCRRTVAFVAERICIKQPLLTLRLKVRDDAYAWLNQAAMEVNEVFNFCNQTSYKAIRPYYGALKCLSGYDLCKLTSGATEYFEHIGADTIQRVCTEYASKRKQAKKARLRWRRSRNPKRSLGWVPFKAASLRRSGKYFRFCGKSIRFFESNKLQDRSSWRDGCFAQDAVGDWYLCLPVPVLDQTPAASCDEVGLDLGLKDTVVSSDGERLAAGRYYRSLESKIAQAQRLGHKRQAKRLHRRAKRRRLDVLHKFSRTLVRKYQTILIGDVSSLALTKTRMAKAVLDSGWGLLKMQLLYKGEYAGRCVQIVSERHTSRTCSSCGSLSGPKGLSELRIRNWICKGCGAPHDRDVNAAINIRFAGRMLPSTRERGLTAKRAA
jgi:putative transposase